MTTLITGGTGKTGSRVAQRLSALGHPFRAVTRHSEPRFDWPDASTWDAALAGCTSAYLTYQPDIGLPGADAGLGAFARRAVTLGCTRLVLLSGRGEDAARQAEAAFIAAGAEWTILRSAFFFQNFTEAFWAEEIAAGSLTMVESAVGEPFIDADDIADVAVATLLDRTAHRDRHGTGLPVRRGARRPQRPRRVRRPRRPRPRGPGLRDLPRTHGRAWHYVRTGATTVAFGLLCIPATT